MADPDLIHQTPAGALDPAANGRQRQQSERTWLAIECAGCGLLLPLSEAGEISQFSGCIGVPHTRSWFLGVANVRGQLHGVVDLAAFLGLVGPAAAPVTGGWMVALNARLEANCALRVDQLAGLRRESELSQLDAEVMAPGVRPRFAGLRYREAAAAQRVWQEINLAELAGDAHFLDILARS